MIIVVIVKRKGLLDGIIAVTFSGQEDRTRTQRRLTKDRGGGVVVLLSIPRRRPKEGLRNSSSTIIRSTTTITTATITITPRRERPNGGRGQHPTHAKPNRRSRSRTVGAVGTPVVPGWRLRQFLGGNRNPAVFGRRRKRTRRRRHLFRGGGGGSNHRNPPRIAVAVAADVVIDALTIIRQGVLRRFGAPGTIEVVAVVVAVAIDDGGGSMRQERVWMVVLVGRACRRRLGHGGVGGVSHGDCEWIVGILLLLCRV